MSTSNPSAFPRAEVKNYKDAPALFINGEPVFPLLLMTGAKELELLEDVAPNAVHLLTGLFEPGWVGIDEYDFSEFDNAMRHFLRTDPNALILPRVQLDAPEAWMAAHPDELVGYEDDSAFEENCWGGARHPSFASRLWRDAAGESLRRLIRHASNSDYAANIIGWHLGSGIYGEWHYWSAVHYPDTSPAFAQAYAQWLQKRDPENTPEAYIPTLADRRGAHIGMFREPSSSRALLNHAEYFHYLGYETLAEFAAIVKAETDRRSIVVAFNGYLPDLDVNHEIDHRAFDLALRNPDLDCFSSPHSYARRKPGDDATMRGFTASVRAMGKLWLDEADERTSLSAPSQWTHVETLEEGIEVLWRSFAHALTHNCGLWFMDQGGLWFMHQGGWYQHKDILQSFAQMLEIGEASMHKPRTRNSEVAVVASLETAFHLADRSSGLDNVTNTLINPTLEQIIKAGAPFDFYLLPELFEANVPEYKAYVFLDTFFLRDADLEKIKALRDAGKTLLFFYAPGFIGEESLSLERMRDLLQMQVEQTEAMVLPDGKEQRPGFRVESHDGEMAEGKMARAGNVFYCPAPPLPEKQLRVVFQNAGVHSYLDSDDTLMVGGGFIAVHAAGDGEKTLRFPRPTNWKNARTGETLAESTPELKVHLKRGETLILEVE